MKQMQAMTHGDMAQPAATFIPRSRFVYSLYIGSVLAHLQVQRTRVAQCVDHPNALAIHFW